jgi:dihydroorotate dehydrogenase (NAD+) catalytic subunit
VEFFIAGASAIAIGTANFVNPQASMDVVKGINAYIQKNNMRSIKELVGSLKVDT